MEESLISLIQSVLSALPTYSLSLFRVPREVAENIEKRTRFFFGRAVMIGVVTILCVGVVHANQSCLGD